MSTIGFIGLGNMGGPMVANLVKAGHRVRAFDRVRDPVERAGANGAEPVADAAAAAAGSDVVITMLPAGEHVRSVWLEDDRVMDATAPDALLIDCSTIDIDIARQVASAAEDRGQDMIDAPVSGGVGGASAGTLTFMCGGSDAAFQRASPILAAMGKNILHAGGPGAGQAAKVCNNLMLAVEMIAVCEGFGLAEKLGLDVQRLFDIASTATSQCWSLTSYCPVPGPVPTSPANRGYQAGFTGAMMLKDLRLSQSAAHAVHADTPLGAHATKLYEEFVNNGGEALDFSAIFEHLKHRV